MPVHWTISHPTRLKGRRGSPRMQAKVEDIEQYFAGVTAEGAMAYRKIFEITATPMALSEQNLQALGQRVMLYAQHGQIGPLALVASSGRVLRSGSPSGRGRQGTVALADIPRACMPPAAGPPLGSRS